MDINYNKYILRGTKSFDNYQILPLHIHIYPTLVQFHVRKIIHYTSFDDQQNLYSKGVYQVYQVKEILNIL